VEHGWQCEALGELGLSEERCTLVTSIRVLFVNGSVMLLGIFTALQHHGYQRSQLGPGVACIISMGLSLKVVSKGISNREKNRLPNHPFGEGTERSNEHRQRDNLVGCPQSARP
jgi:hypothetical protein